MWANLLNILSRSGVGSCLTPRDMRDEANNFVMGLLFLSGDWWEGSGGPGPEPRRPGRLETGARLLLGNPLKLHGQVLDPSCAQKGSQWPAPVSARPRPLVLPSAASSFLPSVKFPVTSMGLHVQHTCDRGTPGRHQGAGLGSVRVLPTCFLSGGLRLASSSCS